jgi:hypothetical protein
MQMDSMVTAYMAWRRQIWGVGLENSPFLVPDGGSETGRIILFDAYSKCFLDLFVSFLTSQ